MSRDTPFAAYTGQEPYVFVSYAHADAGWVYAELEWLHEQGIRIWFDEGIRAGASWTDELAAALEDAAGILFFASPASVESRHAVNELHFALDADKPILTVHFEETPLPGGLRLLLATKQAVIRGDLSVASYRRKLVGAVRRMVSGDDAEVEDYEDVDVAAPVPGYEGRAALAVLPFRELGVAHEEAYFGQGLTEELVVGLQSWREFPIISRESTEEYGSGDVDLPRLARELGVGYALQGTVRRAGGRVRITARLSEARTSKQIWGDRFEGDLADVFELQDRITLGIMGAIEPHLIEQEKIRSARVPTEDLAAWDVYLRGLGLIDRGDYDGAAAAKEHFERATQLDPNFALAHFGIGTSVMFMIMDHRGRLSNAEAMKIFGDGMAGAKEAIRLDPLDHHGHFSLATYLVEMGQYEEALATCEKAAELHKGRAQVHRGLAYILYRARRYERSLEEFAIAKRLSPRDPMMWQMVNQEGACHFALERFDEALTHAERSIALNRVHVWPHLFRVMSLVKLGRQSEAEAAFVDFREQVPDFSGVQLRSIDPEVAKPFYEGLAAVGWVDDA